MRRLLQQRDGLMLGICNGFQALIKLDESLEAVADAQHQAVALLQQTAHRLGDLRVAEEGCNELCTAVRLVAAGEAAGQHDDLAVIDGLDQCLAALGHVGGGQVADDQDLRV